MNKRAIYGVGMRVTCKLVDVSAFQSQTFHAVPEFSSEIQFRDSLRLIPMALREDR